MDDRRGSARNTNPQLPSKKFYQTTPSLMYSLKSKPRREEEEGEVTVGYKVGIVQGL
jgi:hypothetical protein